MKDKKLRTKRWVRFIYSMMIVVISLPYFSSFTVVAETLSADNNPIRFKKIQVNPDDENQIDLTLELNGGAKEEEIKIDYSESLSVDEIKWENSTKENKVELDQEKHQVIVQLLPNEKSQEVLEISLNKEEKRPVGSVEFSYLRSDNSLTSIDLDLPELEVPKSSLEQEVSTESSTSKEESKSEVSSEEITESSKSKEGKVDETEESVEESSGKTTTTETIESSSLESKSKTESSIEKKTEKSEAKKEQKSLKATTSSTDIRTYFPNGNGTILTHGEIIYKNSDGEDISLGDGSLNGVPIGATMKMHYAWAIPEKGRSKINPGDYFDFYLPDQVKPTVAQKGELAGKDGEVYATYKIGTDGKVRFTFTDAVERESDITGDFYFDIKFDRKNVQTTGPIEIKFPKEDKLAPIDVYIRPNTSTEVSKKGQTDRAFNPNNVTWTVDFNQSQKLRKNPTINETWPKGIDFDSVKVYKLVMNPDGSVKAVDSELPASAYVVDSNGNVTIKGETRDTYRIVYQTTIDNSVKPDNGGQFSFTNQVNLVDDLDRQGISAKSTVSANYKARIEKKRSSNSDGGKSGYDPSTQTFNWVVDYNYGEKDIKRSDAKLVDTYSSNTTFDSLSMEIHAVTFDKNGKEIIGEKLLNPTNYIIVEDKDNHNFTIQFTHDIKQAYKLTYSTKAKDTVVGSFDVNNEIKTATGLTTGLGNHGKQVNIVKSTGTPNYKDQTVPWTILVNGSRYEMENLEITDTYNPVPGLSMHLLPGGFRDLQIIDLDSNKKILKEGVDYDLNLNTDGNDNQTGFTIKLKGDYAKTNHKLDVKYVTHFDSDLMGEGNKFTNTAHATWFDITENQRQTSETKATFTPFTEYKNDIGKFGAYNPISKEITWTIHANLSRRQLKGAYISDQIIGKQSYVPDSLKVYKGQIDSAGEVQKADDATDVTITQPNAANDNTLKVNLPDGDKDETDIYVIEYKTSLNDKVVNAEYTNRAVAYNEGKEGKHADATVRPQDGGTFARKSGVAGDKNDPDDARYVYWDAFINPAQSTVSDMVITDQPSPNQIIDEDSIIIYGAKYVQNDSGDYDLVVDKDVLLEKDKDYTVNITTNQSTGKQVMTIKATGTITSAYSLQYRTYVTSLDDNNQSKASNSISISGTGSDIVEGEVVKEVTTNISISGGSASGTKGRITLRKIDADDTDKYLTGAYFKLWDADKKKVLREGKVDDNGQITFGGLPFGDYTLMETEAPDGYTIPDDLVTGRTIKITAQTSAETASPVDVENNKSITIINKLGQVDTDKDWEPKAGAEFLVEKLDSYNDENASQSTWKKVDLKENTTNQQGQLIMRGLGAGIYRVTETKAPSDYIRRLTAHYFVINTDGTNSIVNKDYDFHNMQGAVKLQKNDEYGNALPGAKFEIYKVDDNDKPVGEPVKTDLTTADDGSLIAEYLAPGKYAFVEKKAPDGYLLNTKEYVFTIDDKTAEADGSFTSYVEATNYKADAFIVKRNKEGYPIKGAEFAVFALNEAGQPLDEPVAEKLVSDLDGKVSVLNLGPGKYQFVETKAAEGYLLNTEPVEFEIESSSYDKPTLLEVSKDKGFVNYKGSALLIKKDILNNNLPNAKFQLKDSDGNVIPIKNNTTDENGRLFVENLSPGRYIFEEIEAPDGFILNKSLIPFEISDSSFGEPESVITSDGFINYQGSAKMVKTDAKGVPLAGAEFEVQDSNGKVVQEKLVSDENGQIKVNNLSPGNYKFVEIKAPTGYILNTDTLEFNIGEYAIDDPVEVDAKSLINYQGSAQLIKIDENSNALPGAVFELLDDQDKVVKTDLVSDKEGRIVVDNLAPGHYKFREKEAPQDYALSQEEVEFSIPRENEGKLEIINLGEFVNKFEAREVGGNKYWDDNDNQDGIRPDSITLELYDGNEKVAEEVVKADSKGEWPYEFTGLRKYRDGKEIDYSVKELKVNGYETNYNDDNNDITNIHTTATKDIKVSKVWDDNDNQDGIRPDSVKVQLYANSEKSGSVVVLDESNNWTYSWTDLDVNSKGKNIEYKVEEVDVAEGYKATVSDDQKGNFTITNSYKQKIANKKSKNNSKNNPSKGFKLPSTGEKNDLLLLILGLLVVVGSIGLAWKKKVKSII